QSSPFPRSRRQPLPTLRPADRDSGCRRSVDLAQRCNQLGDGSPSSIIADFEIGPDQLKRLTLDHGIVWPGALRPFQGSTTFPVQVDLVEEVRYRDIKDLREFPQTTCADAVAAVLVFLDLLKGELHRFAQCGLRHSQERTPLSHPRANMNIDRMMCH